MIALIVAAGSGNRMQHAVPKQYLPLKGKAILHHTIQAFLNFHPDMQVVLVIQSGQEHYAEPIISAFPDHKIQMTYGGDTRFQSVQNGLHLVPDNEIVFIHDSARPFVSSSLIQRCYESTIQVGHAIPAIRVKDSFRIWAQGRYEAINRDLLRAIQTPQTFRSTLIKEAYRLSKGKEFTDDASVFEELYQEVNLIDGDEKNMKITTPEDWVIAESILGSMMA